MQTIDSEDNVEDLIKKGYTAIEERAFSDAYRYFKRASVEDPECAEAYWGCFLAHANCNVNEVVSAVPSPFTS